MEEENSVIIIQGILICFEHKSEQQKISWFVFIGIGIGNEPANYAHSRVDCCEGG